MMWMMGKPLGMSWSWRGIGVEEVHGVEGGVMIWRLLLELMELMELLGYGICELEVMGDLLLKMEEYWLLGLVIDGWV